MTESVPSNRVRLQRQSPWPDEINRSELLDLHRQLMEEYRFQVKLNSDRTQIYLALSAAIITAGTGLLKVGGQGSRTLVAIIFVVGIVVAWIAARAVRQGHEYYRAVVYKKTLVEDLLGRHRNIDGYSYKGATLAIETTIGMANERDILDDTEQWLSRPIEGNKITTGLIAVFRLIMVVEIAAILFLVAVAITEVW